MFEQWRYCRSPRNENVADTLQDDFASLIAQPDLEFDSRFSRTVVSRSSSSPGRTAFGSLSSSKPIPARTCNRGWSLVVREMKTAKVWALEAVNPPKIERAAASPSRWRGTGSYCLAN